MREVARPHERVGAVEGPRAARACPAWTISGRPGSVNPSLPDFQRNIRAYNVDGSTLLILAFAVEVRDGVARRADGVLAGSSLSLIEAVRALHALDVPLAEAVEAATAVPARVARRPTLGTLRPGTTADVVVLDDELEIRAVLVGGQELVAA